MEGRDEKGRFINGHQAANPFEKGNKIRQSVYHEGRAEEIIRFFKNETDEGRYPTLYGYAASIGVTSQTLLNWKEAHEDFSIAYELAFDIAKNALLQNAMAGRYNPKFAQFVAINCHGMADKSIQEQVQEKPFEVNINVRKG